MAAVLPTHRLIEVIKALSFCRDLPAVTGTVARAVRELTGADGATFVLRDGDLCYYADEDAIAPLWKGRRFPMTACISGWVMLHGESAVIPDIYADPRVPAEAYRPTFVRSLAMVPVRPEAAIAAIGAYWETAHRAGDEEVEILQALADTAALAIANVELHQERERALVQAQGANHAKDEFLATVSHELRTPLTAILGWARLLTLGHMDAATRRRALETIARNAKAQAHLIDELLDVSRIATGTMTLNVRALALAPVIEAALEAVRPSAQGKGLALDATLDPEGTVVFGDASRLQQIVSNVLSNAVKFTPAGGRVAVLLERRNHEVVVEVADTGRGISPEFLPRVFDRFRQADGSITRRFGGLGLGLAIARELAELHGGTVEAASPGEGLGAVFTVRLPVSRVPEPDVATGEAGRDEVAAPHRDARRLEGIQALVVDDEPDARDVVAAILVAHGAFVSTLGTVREAVGMLDSVKPDVVVADLAMPDADGYALIRAIRAREAGLDHLPAVAVSALARSADRAKALSEGYDAYLTKPVEPEQLVATVERLLRNQTGGSDQASGPA